VVIHVCHRKIPIAGEPDGIEVCRLGGIASQAIHPNPDVGKRHVWVNVYTRAMLGEAPLRTQVEAVKPQDLRPLVFVKQTDSPVFHTTPIHRSVATCIPGRLGEEL